MQKKQYIVECAKYSVASEIFIYNRKDIATEVFEVLCTVYEHDARISLRKDGKEIQYASIEKNKADYKVVKVA